MLLMSLFGERRFRLLERKPFILVGLIIIIFLWIFNCQYVLNTCEDHDNVKVNYIKTSDDISSGEQSIGYNKYMPLIFVGGVPRSGTTLMRAMLDAHPSVRCGEETRIVPRIIATRMQWLNNVHEAKRLKNAGIDTEIIDSAVRSFILEVIVKHGATAERLCNKDPLVLRYSDYVGGLFPNSKFVLMIRDGRATVHSIITRKVTITGFNLESYRDCMKRWNTLIEHMYAQCMVLGPDRCLPVYYEQLVLHPEAQMRNILEFLGINWHENVLHHEEFIGEKIQLSKIERSSDQVIKPINLDALNTWVGKIPADVTEDMDRIAPMLRKLGYDPNANPPNYGVADPKIAENTYKIRADKKYWADLAQKYSIHADNANQQF